MRTWSQHTTGDGPDGVRRQSRGRGGDAWRVRPELKQQSGVSLKKGHENLLTSRLAAMHAATISSKEAGRTLGLGQRLTVESAPLPSTPAVHFAPLPLPAFPGCGDPARGGERSRLGSQMLG